jgi:ubiquitin C-terminal hydrolase
MGKGKEGKEGGGQGEGELLRALRLFVGEMHASPPGAPPGSPPGTPPAAASLGPEAAVVPSQVLQAVSSRHARYGRRTQQDSHEVLRQLLEGMRAELVQAAKAAEKGGGEKGGEYAANGGAPANGVEGGRARGARGEEEPTTLVDTIFRGWLRSTVVCLTCGSVSCAREPFLDLSLPIVRPRHPPTPDEPSRAASSPNASATAASGAAALPAAGAATAAAAVASPCSVDAPAGSLAGDVLRSLPAELRDAHASARLAGCVQALCAPEVLEGENAYLCGACDARLTRAAQASGAPVPPIAARVQSALKWLQIEAVPRTLTLHLKRFRATGRSVHKLEDSVPFPPSLDLTPFTCTPGPPAMHCDELRRPKGKAAELRQPSGRHVPLRLYALVEHEGSPVGGHYVAYVRLAEGCWYRMSDSDVSRIDEAKVLEKQAFLLFYERLEDAAA